MCKAVGPKVAGFILDQKHLLALEKLRADFARSRLGSIVAQSNAGKEERRRIATLMDAWSVAHLAPFAPAHSWQFPQFPVQFDDPSIPLDRVASHLQMYADRCGDAIAAQRGLLGSRQIVVNTDCIDVACTAVILSLALNRGIPIHLDYDYSYGTEQVTDLPKKETDVLITVDGSFVGGCARDYRIIGPVHSEEQCDVVFQAEQRLPRGDMPRVISIERSSLEEQTIIEHADYAGLVPKAVEDFVEFRDILKNQLRPNDHIIMLSPMAWHAVRALPLVLSIKNKYPNFVAMSIHSRWFEQGKLAVCMQRFLDLFIIEWTYLRADAMQGGEMAFSLLLMDNTAAGYKADTFFDRLWSVSTAVIGLDAKPIPMPATPLVDLGLRTHASARSVDLVEIMGKKETEQMRNQLITFYVLGLVVDPNKRRRLSNKQLVPQLQAHGYTKNRRTIFGHLKALEPFFERYWEKIHPGEGCEFYYLRKGRPVEILEEGWKMWYKTKRYLGE
jgi:hypothetical protein